MESHVGGWQELGKWASSAVQWKTTGNSITMEKLELGFIAKGNQS